MVCFICEPVHFRVLTDATDLNRAASFVGGSYEPVVAVVITWRSFSVSIREVNFEQCLKTVHRAWRFSFNIACILYT